MAQSSRRLRVAVLFGGRSAEHDVSVLSAANVMRALDPARYDAVPIFVTRDGRWLVSSYEDATLATPPAGTEACLVPGGRGRMLAVPADGPPSELPKIDLLFPVLHGLHGEDGAVQGVAEVARVPLVGCGLLGSAVALDKDVAKRLLAAAGLPVTPSLTIREDAVPSAAALGNRFGFPFFVKPARQGSSVGVGKVSGPEDLGAALAEGFRHDGKLLAEQFIDGREIEVSVLEDANGTLFVSRPGEVAPAAHHAFYSYDAKYVDGGGAVVSAPAELPPEVEATLRDIAAEAFRALGCDGMARVDFFLAPDGRVFVNEVNTIPGFTDVSMYAKAMAASGVAYPELLDRLVAHGLARAGKTAS